MAANLTVKSSDKSYTPSTNSARTSASTSVDVPVGKSTVPTPSSAGIDMPLVKAIQQKLKLVDAKIAELESKENITSDERYQLEALKDIQAARDEYVDVLITNGGSQVSFFIKKDIPAEELKELFLISDGAFRGQLDAEVENGEQNGVFDKYHYVLGFIPWKIRDYEAAILSKNRLYSVPSSSFKGQEALDELLEKRVADLKKIDSM